MRTTLLRHRLRTLAVGALSAWAAMAVHAQGNADAYPDKPVTLIVPTAAAGGTDTISRLIADALSKSLKQPFIIDNRPGANGILGTELAARATPDGYKLLFTYAAAMVVNPSLYRKLPYDPVKDFAPVAQIGRGGNLLLVRQDLPVKTLKEFVAYAKARPGGQTTFGSAGQGTGVHLAAEQFRAQAGLDMTHIPYKGTGQAITELIGGQTTMLFVTQSGAKPQAAAGRLRPIAITSPKRTAVMPEVPTFIESGFPGVDAVTINGLVAPAGTPPDYVMRVNAAVNKALKTKELQDKMVEQGFSLAGGTPDEFTAWIRTEIPKWNKVVKDAGLKME